MAAAPAPGNWKAGGAPAPPCCNADMSAAIGSSGGGAAVVEDAAMEGATAVEDDDVDEALGLGCSAPGNRPEAAAPRRAFMNCCCCSSLQTDGSGAADPRPAALKGDACASLTLRVPGVDMGGVGMSDVSPTKFVRPRLGSDEAVLHIGALHTKPREARTYRHACMTHPPRRGRR